MLAQLSLCLCVCVFVCMCLLARLEVSCVGCHRGNTQSISQASNMPQRFEPYLIFLFGSLVVKVYFIKLRLMKRVIKKVFLLRNQTTLSKTALYYSVFYAYTGLTTGEKCFMQTQQKLQTSHIKILHLS